MKDIKIVILNSFEVIKNQCFDPTTKIRVQVTVKVKLSMFLTKHHVMKTYWGSGGIAPFVL
jgi:hypothetical protein